MSKSVLLRAADVRAIVQLVAACRELGDDATSWRAQLVAGLADLVGAELGSAGEMGGCESPAPRDLGVTHWMAAGLADPAVIEATAAELRRDPAWAPVILQYLSRSGEPDAACLSRRDLLPDRDWYDTRDYQLVQRPCGLDHILWCFLALPGPATGDRSGIILCRAAGRRDFSARDRAIVLEAHAALAPLVGGPLARYSEPSPLGLPPRTRKVLACLLEGDGDKQVAARLGMSPFTVNEHTKAIYRHFGVRGRAELLARWVRRGWGGRFAWSEG
ncbi:MAG TPA: helix-turn-helix transcriptional regulator [Isosphaeraceae bacterium]|jgi:DNA-binding CsgD family transcriptional regulator|nr:helix-turn-helix transcriptional regulator [Isosphaeraceae bacterium]